MVCTLYERVVFLEPSEMIERDDMSEWSRNVVCDRKVTFPESSPVQFSAIKDISLINFEAPVLLTSDTWLKKPANKLLFF